MNDCLKAYLHTKVANYRKWSFVIVEESIIILGERRKKGRVRAEPSDPKRTKGYFRCGVSIDRFTNPSSFIRQAGCPPA